MRLPQLCCLNKVATIRLPQVLLNQMAAPISLNKAIIDATFKKSPHYNLEYAFLVPHSTSRVPQECLRCLRELETLLKQFTLLWKTVVMF